MDAKPRLYYSSLLSWKLIYLPFSCFHNNLFSKQEILGPKFTVPNQSCCTKNGDSTRAWKYSFRDYNSADDHNIGHTDFSLEHYELPCMTWFNSSYETRLYDWIPKLSNDQSQAEIHGEGNGLDWCFCDPTWNSEDCDPSTVDSLGSLWYMS